MLKSNCLKIKPTFNLIRLLLSSNTLVALFISILISLCFMETKPFISLFVFLALFITSILIILFSFFMNYRATLYEISKDEINFNEGFINHQAVSIKIKNIKEIHLTQSFIQRVFNLGTIRVLTAGSNAENGGGLKMRDIKNSFYTYIQLNRLHRQNLNKTIDDIKEDETTEINLKPNSKSPYYLIISIPIVLAILFMPTFAAFIVRNPFIFVYEIVFALLATALIWFMFKLEYKNRKYKIFNTRIECREGFFNHQYTTIDVRNIREIRLERGFFQRIFNLGSVVISSPANSHCEEGAEPNFVNILLGTAFSKNNKMSYYKIGIKINNIDESSHIYKMLNSMQDYSNSNNARNILNDKPQFTYKPTFYLRAQVLSYAIPIISLLICFAFFFINPMTGFLVLFTLLLVMYVIPMFLTKKNYDCTKYEVYPTRIEFHEGFILNKSSSILIKNIREIHFDENFLQKMFGLGTIKLITSGSDDSISYNGSGIAFRDVKNGKDIYEKLNSYVKNNIVQENIAACEDSKEETEAIEQKEEVPEEEITPTPRKISDIKPKFVFLNIFLTNFIPATFVMFLAFWSRMADGLVYILLALIIAAVASLIISSIISIVTLFNYNATKYSLEDDKIVFDEGFINHKHTAVEYKNIREVLVDQNVIQRLFKIGTIKVLTSASTNFSGLKIKDVINPYEIYENIENRILNNRVEKPVFDLKPKMNILYVLLTYGFSGVVAVVFFPNVIGIIAAPVILVLGFVKHLRNSYKVFDNKIEYSFSFISKFRGVIPREKIREMHVKQGPLQKMFNMGQLLIVTSASGKKGSLLFNIPKPNDVKKQLS